MKKIILFLLISSGLFILLPQQVIAVNQSGSCTWTVKDKKGNKPPAKFDATDPFLVDIFETVGRLNPGGKYRIRTKCTADYCGDTSTVTANTNGVIEGHSIFSSNTPTGTITISIEDLISGNSLCSYTINADDWKGIPTPVPKVNAECRMEVIQNKVSDPEMITSDQNIIIHGQLLNFTGGAEKFSLTCFSDDTCYSKISGPSNKTFGGYASIKTNKAAKTFDLDIGRGWPKGTYSARTRIQLFDIVWGNFHNIDCNVNFNVGMPGGVVTTAPTPLEPYPSLAPLCDQIPGEFRADCKNCVESQGKIWTAIGCIAPDFGSFISQQILKVGVGIAGGIAFLYFLYGALLFLTSAGNPEKVAMAREIIMSSLLGLMLIIFSVYLLGIIAIDVLDLGRFGFTRS